MTCEKCGRTELYFLPKTHEESHEKHVQEAMKEMESWDCDKLAIGMMVTFMSFRYEAAKRILLKRGHQE